MSDSEKSLSERLAEFKAKERTESLEYKRERLAYQIESEKSVRKMWSLLEHKIRKASVADYLHWLKGFMLNGGKPTHYYEYPITNILDEWFVAITDFEIAPACGANSIHIIVPKGVHFKGGKLGHNVIYFMEDFTVMDSVFVPIYSDTKL